MQTLVNRKLCGAWGVTGGGEGDEGGAICYESLFLMYQVFPPSKHGVDAKFEQLITS